MRLTQLVIPFTDIRVAASRIMGLWSSEIGLLLPEGNLSTVSPLIKHALIKLNTQLADVRQSTLSQLTFLGPYISNQIVFVLTRGCCELVVQVKQVTGQIMAMTRRKVRRARLCQKS